jgi:malto-oligosyltrehalose trehalohydrolase
MKRHHHLQGGAEVVGATIRFRFWAPEASAVDLVLEDGRRFPMVVEPGGWFALRTAEAAPGSRYRYAIGDDLYADPVSRFQPEGPGGPSEVVDPARHVWRDQAWPGIPWETAVLYELHTGTFSETGDFAGIARRLDHLVALGVNAIEIMPVAECPGRWNWGYDGVFLYAVEERYGGPEGLKTLVDACHACGIAVILDVVYNHFGPEGNFLATFAPSFFTERHHTPWGAAINFDDHDAPHVRDFFIDNALFWLDEYHLDGLRLDAVHAIIDDTEPNILVELGNCVRERFPDRQIHLILENDDNKASLIGWRAGGKGPFTAQWNDDFHHAMRVLVANAHGGYYADYQDDPMGHLGRVLTEGFAQQGEASEHRHGQRRGEASGQLPPTAFVAFIQNHDQVGNHAFGWRLPRLTREAPTQAAIAVLLLSPQVPMLWQGEEWNADQPFPYFCDFTGDLAEAVRQGRLKEFERFPEYRDPEALAKIPDPTAEETYRSAVLDWQAVHDGGHAASLALYTRLIGIRRRWIVPHLSGVGPHAGRVEFLGPRRLDIAWTLAQGVTLRLRLNLADEPAAASAPAPGQLLYATAESRDGILPPWYVAATLSEPVTAASHA